jgi:hypothetical protein
VQMAYLRSGWGLFLSLRCAHRSMTIDRCPSPTSIATTRRTPARPACAVLWPLKFPLGGHARRHLIRTHGPCSVQQALIGNQRLTGSRPSSRPTPATAGRTNSVGGNRGRGSDVLETRRRDHPRSWRSPSDIGFGFRPSRTVTSLGYEAAGRDRIDASWPIRPASMRPARFRADRLPSVSSHRRSRQHKSRSGPRISELRPDGRGLLQPDDHAHHALSALIFTPPRATSLGLGGRAGAASICRDTG